MDDKVITLEQKHFSIASDWAGKSIEKPIIFDISLNSKNLFNFHAEVPLPIKKITTSAHGEYIEGLWEFDVAELFLVFRDTTYLELNFSPTGAWWGQYFSSYRKRDTDPLKITILSTSKPVIVVDHVRTFWTLTASFPAENILSKEIVAINCCVIHHDEPVRYFSLNATHEVEPDFHYAKSFVPV